MYDQRLPDRSFHALAHPARLRIVERLAAGPAPVGRAADGLGLTKPAVTKHVKVLEAAGLVEREVVGRIHRLRLVHPPLEGAAAWLERQRALWESKLDVVERFLEETAPDER